MHSSFWGHSIELASKYHFKEYLESNTDLSRSHTMSLVLVQYLKIKAKCLKSVAF